MSVIIPTYNSAHLILQTLHSVLDQSYRDYEIIVVDDGSTDNTCQVLEPYRRHIRYIWQQRSERSAARNRGIALAAGEYIAFLDADDLWYSDFLAAHVHALDANSDAVVSYSPVECIDSQGHASSYDGTYTAGRRSASDSSYWELDYPQASWLFGVAIFTCGALCRIHAVREAQGFDPALTMGEDWDLWLRLGRLGTFVPLPKVMSAYRTYEWTREVTKRATDLLVDQYLYVIDKAARADPLHISPALQQEAAARVYLQSGLASYQLGDDHRGRRMLNLACDKSAELCQDEVLAGFLEDRARRLLNDCGDERRVLNFLEAVIGDLPEHRRRTFPSAHNILSRVFMADVFSATPNRDGLSVLRSVWKGMRYNPRWVHNRGVLSISVKALWRVLAVTRGNP